MPDKDYGKLADEIMPKKKVAITSPENPDAQEWTEIESYNSAIDDCKPIVMKLLREIDELKELNKCYTCGSIDEAPRYCIECYSKLEKQIDELKGKI